VLKARVMVFLLWDEGSVMQDLMVLEFLSQVLVRLASFKFGAKLNGLKGVESAVSVVASPVFIGKLTSG